MQEVHAFRLLYGEIGPTYQTSSLAIAVRDCIPTFITSLFALPGRHVGLSWVRAVFQTCTVWNSIRLWRIGFGTVVAFSPVIRTCKVTSRFLPRFVCIKVKRQETVNEFSKTASRKSFQRGSASSIDVCADGGQFCAVVHKRWHPLWMFLYSRIGYHRSIFQNMRTYLNRRCLIYIAAINLRDGSELSSDKYDSQREDPHKQPRANEAAGEGTS